MGEPQGENTTPWLTISHRDIDKSICKNSADGRPCIATLQVEVDMLAAIYARYSSDRQRDASIDDQVRLCKEFIARQGWEVGPIYSDRGQTGSVASRAGYQDLLAAVKNGGFEVIVSESLDRLTRDQEHVAHLDRRCRYARIPIHTCSEGRITKLHIGLKGTMNAIFLDDLADKTRRGLRGRVEAGASAGGLTYGYDLVAVREGEDRGGRTINADEADVVRRIFRDYANGISPRAIAAALNREGVPGPRVDTWSQSTINGNRRRGTGVLNNEIYAGELVWNRLRYEKDPDSDKRRSQLNPESEWLRRFVPDLRIVDQSLIDAVRARQDKLDGGRDIDPDLQGKTPFWKQQRPTYLLSGLIRCGSCGGGMSVISATHIGCSNARNKGEAVCANRRTVKRVTVETTVLDRLQVKLMAPDVYASFVRGFMAEWNAEQGGRAVKQDGQRDELRGLERKIGNLVAGIADSGGSPAVYAALKEAEARKAAIVSGLAVAEAPAPRLLPNLAEVYRAEIASLHDALDGDDAAAVRERIRGLIDEIRLIPSPADTKAPPVIEVRGDLAAMLALGCGSSEAASLALASQMKLVAGAGFEPAAFRL